MGGYKVAMTDSLPLWTSPSEPMDLSCAVGSRDVVTSGGDPQSGYPDYNKELPLDLSTTTSPRCEYEPTSYYQARVLPPLDNYDCQYPEAQDGNVYHGDNRAWSATAMKRYDGYSSPPLGNGQCATRGGACRYDSYPSGVMTEVDRYCRGTAYNWHEPEHPGQRPFHDQYRTSRYRYHRDGYRPYRYDRPLDNGQHLDYYCWRHNGKYEPGLDLDNSGTRRAVPNCYRTNADNAYCDVTPAGSRPSCMTSGGGFSYSQDVRHALALPVKQCDTNINQKVNKRTDTLRKRLRQKDVPSCDQMSPNAPGESHGPDSLVVIASNKHWAGGILTSDVSISGTSPRTCAPDAIINIPVHLLNTSLDGGSEHIADNRESCAAMGSAVRDSKTTNISRKNTTSDCASADHTQSGDYSAVKVKQENIDS